MGLNKEKAFQTIKDIAAKSNAMEVFMGIPGYPEPEKLSFHGGFATKKYSPDAILNYEDRSDLYSVESSLSKKTLAEALHKWILFSTTAKKKNGEFYLIVEEDKKEDFVKLLKSKMINADVITIKQA